jgi:hypothetical protein
MTADVTVVPQPRLLPAAAAITHERRKLPLRTQALLQLICLVIAATVLFPLLWVVTMRPVYGASRTNDGSRLRRDDPRNTETG